jgi:hypothetical protein
MKEHGCFAVCATAAALAAVGLLSPSVAPLVAQQGKGFPDKARVYVYPQPLTARDKLSFGPDTEQKKTIPIKETTTLIYVDLAPGARFAHPTECILVSSEGARVIRGDWWLILNGKALFRDGKDYKVDFPMVLSGK